MTSTAVRSRPVCEVREEIKLGGLDRLGTKQAAAAEISAYHSVLCTAVEAPPPPATSRHRSSVYRLTIDFDDDVRTNRRLTSFPGGRA